ARLHRPRGQRLLGLVHAPGDHAVSVRDDPVLFLQQGKGKTVGGSSVGGGSAITTTHVHRLNGPEHTLATDDDRLNATGGEPGLLPKLSGIPADALRGDGSWAQVDVDELVTSETDTALVAAPDGAGGVEFRAEAGTANAELNIE